MHSSTVDASYLPVSNSLIFLFFSSLSFASAPLAVSSFSLQSRHITIIIMRTYRYAMHDMTHLTCYSLTGI